MEHEVIDLSKLCRTCKAEASDLRPLHTRDTESGEDLRADEMLMFLTDIKVEESDKLPHSICYLCITRLKSAFAFKQLCETSDKFYKDLLHLTDEKFENKDDKNENKNDKNENRNDKNENKNENTKTFEEILSQINDPSIKNPTEKENDLNLNKNRDYIEVLDNNIVILTCRQCFKVFTSIDELRTHKRIHSKETFKCKQCKKEYFSWKSLNRHEMTHLRTKFHVCKICNLSISHEGNLKKHLMIHLKDRPYKCEGCTRGYTLMIDLEYHRSKCKGQKVFTCKICSKSFNREDSCMLHEKTHEDQQFDLPTLENINNFNEFYHLIDLNDENLNIIPEEASDEDVGEIPCEVLMTPMVEKDPLLQITKSEIYAEEDPPEIMEEKARIEEEMFQQNLYKDENYQKNFQDKYQDEKYEEIDFKNDDSSESEYFPIPQKKKRGRPRKKPLKRGRGRPKRIKLEGEHSCPDCNQIFSDLSLLQDHMIKHECTFCKKRFMRFTHLRRHLLTHSETKPFQCEQCDKSFTRLDHLQQHIKIHDQYVHTCSSCGSTFSRLPQLKKHMLNEHDIQTVKKSEKKFHCNICLKGFTTEKYRNVHMRGHDVLKPFQCRICEKTFASKSHLTEHMKFHSESSKKFLCSECGQRFIRHDYLIIHMRRHRGEKPFKCKFCGKGFPRTTDLHVHERYHTGEKTHLCVICGRGFGRAYNLRVHMRTHTGERPYQCTYCPAAFAQGNDLKAHIRRHTGERFQCDLCEETFLMGYLLTQHKRSVHGLNIVGNIRRLLPPKKFNDTNEEPTTVSLPEPVILKEALLGTRLQTEVKSE